MRSAKCIHHLSFGVLFVCFLFQGAAFSAHKPHQKPLHLNTVLKKVDACYPQIQMARLEVIKAKGNFLSAKGKFDPALNINTNFAPVGGYINNYGDGEIVVPTLLNGLKFVGGYRNGQGDWPVYYQNYLTNSGGEYRGGVSFPLLRDRKIDKERTALIKRSVKITMNRQELAATKIRIYHEVIRAYWQWVQTGLQLRFFKHLLTLAEERQKIIEKQAHNGDLPRIAISENLQQLMQRQQLVNQGSMLLKQASINLSIYYRDDKGHPKRPLESQLPASIRPPKPINLAQVEKFYRLICRHPALEKLESYRHLVVLEKNLAKNDLLPYLDANAYTTKQYGTGGYPLLIPQAVMAGVTFKLPVYRRAAKGQYVRANSELQRVTTEKKFVFDQLNNQLSNLLVSAKVYRQQLDLLDRELKFAKTVQAGEQEKFYAGDSSLFLVNQREQVTTQVLLNRLQTKVNLKQTHDLLKFFVNLEIQRRSVLPTKS